MIELGIHGSRIGDWACLRSNSNYKNKSDNIMSEYLKTANIKQIEGM